MKVKKDLPDKYMSRTKKGIQKIQKLIDNHPKEQQKRKISRQKVSMMLPNVKLVSQVTDHLYSLDEMNQMRVSIQAKAKKIPNGHQTKEFDMISHSVSTLPSSNKKIIDQFTSNYILDISRPTNKTRTTIQMASGGASFPAMPQSDFNVKWDKFKLQKNPNKKQRQQYVSSALIHPSRSESKRHLSRDLRSVSPITNDRDYAQTSVNQEDLSLLMSSTSNQNQFISATLQDDPKEVYATEEKTPFKPKPIIQKSLASDLHILNFNSKIRR